MSLSGAFMGQHGIGPGMTSADISAPGTGGLDDAGLEEMVSKAKRYNSSLRGRANLTQVCMCQPRSQNARNVLCLKRMRARLFTDRC